MKKLYFIYISILIFLPILLPADELHHISGRVISGKIVNETEDKISIYTERYGKLTYDKLEITKIVRGTGEQGQSNVSQTQQNSSQPTSPFSQDSSQSSASETSLNPFAQTSQQTSPFGSPQQAQSQPNQPEDQETTIYSAEAGIPTGFDAQIVSLNGKVLVKKIFNFEPVTTVTPLKAGMRITSIANNGDLISLKLNSGSAWFYCPEKNGLISFSLATPTLIMNTNDNFHFKVSIIKEKDERGKDKERTQLDINTGDIKVIFSRETSRQIFAHSGKSITISYDGVFSPQQQFDIENNMKEWNDLFKAPNAPPSQPQLASQPQSGQQVSDFQAQSPLANPFSAAPQQQSQPQGQSLNPFDQQPPVQPPPPLEQLQQP
jgi:hypothetical protein